MFKWEKQSPGVAYGPGKPFGWLSINDLVKVELEDDAEKPSDGS
jgi:hypothetical protein